jgi:hypothetical protein
MKANEAAYTPGPWKLRKAGEYIGDEAQCFDFVEVARQRFIIVEGLSEEEANANAKLIAAAPLLVETLLDLRAGRVAMGWDTAKMDAALKAAGIEVTP